MMLVEKLTSSRFVFLLVTGLPCLVLGMSDEKLPYFPPKAFYPDNPLANRGTTIHLSEQLRVFTEESFQNHVKLDKTALRCRLLWLASNYHPICIIASRDDNKWTLHAMQHSGNPGNVNDSPKIIIDKVIELKDSEAKELEKLLENTQPWKESRIDNTSGQADGDLLLFEVAKKEQYNIFYRLGHTLEDDEKLLFQKLMELSGKEIYDQWKSFRRIK